MLTVETYIKPSEIEGTGLFAAQPIAKGGKLWVFQPGFDIVYDVKEVREMPKSVQDYLEEYASLIPQLGKLLLCGDNDRFTNHSYSPNRRFEFVSPTEMYEFATRNIAVGEELTNNYQEFDADFLSYASRLR